MKRRLALVFSFILATQPAQAGLISLPEYLSGNDVTISNLNTTNTTLEDTINGGIAGGGVNIQPGSITSIDMANSISPVKRWDEAFSDFTPSGMLPATSANLTSNISAGVSYVNGLRIEKNATANTYTASKDTYVYISETGSYQFQEVANGAAAPATPANTLLLAKVVTDTDNITSVSDLRSTSITITATASNFPLNYRDQAFISWDSTTTTHVEPGNLAIGTTIYTRTSDTSSRNITTAANWIEGGVPTLTTPIKVYIYAYNDSGSSFDFKYSSADPVYSDTSSNTAGILRYYTSGGTNYRAIGWLLASADAVQSHHIGNFYDMGVRNVVRNTYTAVRAITTAMPADNTTPLISEGQEVFRVAIVPSNASSKIRVTAKVSMAPSTSERASAALFDGSNQLLTAQASPTGATNHQLTLTTIHTPGTTNFVEYKVRAGGHSSSTAYLNANESGTGFYSGLLNTFIEAEEIGA